MKFWIPLIAIGTLLFSACSSNKGTETKPERGTIVEAVYSSAVVQPYNYYTVYSTISGVIHKRYVSQGDLVSIGSPLFMVESKTTDLNYENAKLVYELAQKNLNSKAAILKDIEAEMQNAQLRFKNDSLNYFRQKALFDKKVGTLNDLEIKKLQYTTSINNLKVIENRYKRTLDELKTDAQIKQNQLLTNKAINKDLLMTSNLNGKIYDVKKKEAEFISIQEPFAIIGSADSFKVELLVDEIDVARVKLGQKVIVSLNSYTNELFEAQISKIYPMMDSRTQSFQVDCFFKTKPATLYMGLSGEANIIINEKNDALLIPREYLINDSTVSTSKGNIKVKRGIIGLDKVEILSGLEKDASLVKPVN